MLKIEEKNKDKINAALSEVNGNATTHTFNDYSEVIECMTIFENKLLPLPVKLQTGCFMTFLSGDKVANSYKYARQATSMRIIKKSTGFFIDDIQSKKISNYGGKNSKVNIPKESLDYLIDKIKDSYIVIDKV